MPEPPELPDSVTDVLGSLTVVRRRLADLESWVDQVMQQAAARPLDGTVCSDPTEGMVSLDAVPVEPLPDLTARFRSQGRIGTPS